MARKIVHQLVDDLDGTVLDIGDGETVHFSLDGTSYEIDLTEDNARRLRDALQPFVAAGRRGVRTSARSQTKRTPRNEDTALIRAWAQENGHPVSSRGRIPADIVAAYHAAR